MQEVSNAYALAEKVFDTFIGTNDLLSPAELQQSRILSRAGHMTNTPGIVAFGEKEGARFSQRLSLGRNDIFYLSTVCVEPGGAYTREHITPSSDKGLHVVEESLFVSALVQVLSARTSC